VIAQAMIAGAAVFALVTGAGPESVTPPVAGGEAKSVKSSQKQVTDHEGNQLILDLDDAGKVVKAEAKDRQGKPLQAGEIKMKDMQVCIPRTAGAKDAKPLCQTLAYVTDGSFFKMGTASCTCYVVGGTLICYGTTCK
jgi:hypothetical protein